MAINKSDFNKIWASTSPLAPYTFTENNYKEGWNFIGATPPARQMWDFLQKNNDEKMQFIVNDLLVPVNIDETSASGNYYSTSVPSDKVFSNFNSIGGKTIAWNQLCDKCLNPSGTIQITASGNGVFVINGSTTGSETHQFSPTTYSVSGHKYYVAMHSSSTLANRDVIIYNNNGGIELNDTGSLIASANSDKIFILRLNDNVSFSNVTVKVKVIDLTLAFGSGNEPTTTAEVEVLFPAETYPYNAGTLLSASVDKVISKDSSNNTIATMPIPSAIQSLDGYGWSAGSVYNYIDFERKKFVKRVGSVDLGSLTWGLLGDSFYVNNFASNNSAKQPSANINKANIVCPLYVTNSASNMGANEIAINSGGTLLVVDSAYNDASAFKTAMAGVMLYYELATPIETDISSILGASGIATSSGGSLTFQNSNGDNYRLPVSVSMDYVADADGLITSQDKEKIEVAYEAVNTPNPYLPLSGGTMTGGITLDDSSISGYIIKSKYDTSDIKICGGTSDGKGAYIWLFGKDSAGAGRFDIFAVDGVNTGGDLRGTATGSLTWNGQTIQTSSDRRLKQDFSDVPADVLEAWGKVEWRQFRYKADAERKGAENCRWHVGLVAQDVAEIGKENDIDLLKYGILCHDVSEETDLWTIRYEEALAMEVIYLRKKIAELEAKLEKML